MWVWIFVSQALGAVFTQFDNSYSLAEKYASESIQGIVNRSGPQLMIAHSGKNWKAGYTFAWADIYKKHYGITFEDVKSFSNLFSRFRGSLKGIVVYDPKIDGTKCVALTLAGVDDLLPVDAELLNKYKSLFGELPIKHDLRNRFKNSLEAYEWALKNVIPRCNRRMADTPSGPDVDGVKVGNKDGYWGYDWVISHRGVIFNLGLEYKDKLSFGKAIKGNKAQADLYRRILAALEPQALIFGYGQFEQSWFSLLGQYGDNYLYWGDNLSFHEQVKANSNPVRQKAHTALALDPRKITVCFVTSEGDTMKGPLPFWFGSWNDPRRGEVPMNWTIPPWMHRFPAILDYYYRNASANDYFIGMQVCNIESTPSVDSYASALSSELHLSDLSVFCDSTWKSPPSAIKREAFYRKQDLLGIVESAGSQREGFQSYLSNGTPVVGTATRLDYWRRSIATLDDKAFRRAENDPAQWPMLIKAAAAEIEQVASAHKPPFVITLLCDIHGSDKLCALHSKIAAALDPKRFQVARLDDAFDLLQKTAVRQKIK